MAPHDFDIDRFLSQPLTARLATAGPSVRPVWYLWEDQRFWVLSGPWNNIPADVKANPDVAIVVDTCDLGTGECLQVVARGRGELVPYDPERGRRKLVRYLGTVLSEWDPRFRGYLLDEPQACWLRITPGTLAAKDLSFVPSFKA